MKVATRAATVLATLVAVFAVVMPATAEQPGHCVLVLVPVEEYPAPGPIEVDAIDLGCYPTYSEAVEVGTGGATDLPAGTTPSAASQQLLSASTSVEPLATEVLIGTEYTETNFDLSSRSYFAPTTCSSGVTWELGYVGDNWNNDFESGKGFGGCDNNKKFRNINFGGEVLTCTPTCANYGTLKNEVSSLRWRP